MILNDIINKHYDQLNENDLYIWQYIIHHQEACQKMSIQQLAKECNVSHSTIIRFTKKIGLDGYSELKYYLKWSLNQENKFNYRTLNDVTNELQETIDMMKNRDLDQILKFIKEAKHIYVYSTGDVQRHAAKELKREFVFCKKIFYLIEGETEIDDVLRYVTKDDIFILISFSGENETVVTLAKALKRLKISTIGIGVDKKNLLSQYVDEYIGFHTSMFQTGYFDNEYCCTSHYFLITNMLFLRYLEYCS